MYLSTRLDAIKKTLNTLCKTATEEEKSFYESLYDLVSATAQQVDVIGSRLDELEEKTENFETYNEHLSASLQALRDCIVGDVTVDTDDYTADYDEHHHDGCDCGCEHEHEHEHEHDCDCGCENDGILTLTDEDGNTTDFVVIDGVESEGTLYLALVEKDQMDNEESEYIVLKVVNEGEDEEALVTVDDEDEFNTVIKLFEAKADNAGLFDFDIPSED